MVLDVTHIFIAGPEKRHIPHKVVDSGNGVFRIEFTTVEVGSYVIDVNVSGLSVPNSPLIAKAYDASLIKVTDITDGVVADLSTFRGKIVVGVGIIIIIIFIIIKLLK